MALNPLACRSDGKIGTARQHSRCLELPELLELATTDLGKWGAHLASGLPCISVHRRPIAPAFNTVVKVRLSEFRCGVFMEAKFYSIGQLCYALH